MPDISPDFDKLTPDIVIDAVETAIGIELTNYTQPMPSYINRVYELKSTDDDFYIAKFYRPGRWSNNALLDEHQFMTDCSNDEIPLASPLKMEGLVNKKFAPTLGTITGYPFAVFKRRGGRLWEITKDDSWYRIGRLLGRMHNTGAKRIAKNRIKISDKDSFASDIKELKLSNWIHPDVKNELFKAIDNLQIIVNSMFERFSPGDDSFIRVHGDFHSGNILERPEEGLMLIDFDDMAMSLPVQDLWLLLPDHAPDCMKEISNLLDGYMEFRTFDKKTLMLIEPLRAMRMIYFLCWCGRQKEDYRFLHSFPDWGSKAFWLKEIQDIEFQQNQIKRAIDEQKLPCF